MTPLPPPDPTGRPSTPTPAAPRRRRAVVAVVTVVGLVVGFGGAVVGAVMASSAGEDPPAEVIEVAAVEPGDDELPPDVDELFDAVEAFGACLAAELEGLGEEGSTGLPAIDDGAVIVIGPDGETTTATLGPGDGRIVVERSGDVVTVEPSGDVVVLDADDIAERLESALAGLGAAIEACRDELPALISDGGLGDLLNGLPGLDELGELPDLDELLDDLPDLDEVLDDLPDVDDLDELPELERLFEELLDELPELEELLDELAAQLPPELRELLAG